jgi:hypothetical protein
MDRHQVIQKAYLTCVQVKKKIICDYVKKGYGDDSNDENFKKNLKNKNQ